MAALDQSAWPRPVAPPPQAAVDAAAARFEAMAFRPHHPYYSQPPPPHARQGPGYGGKGYGGKGGPGRRGRGSRGQGGKHQADGGDKENGTNGANGARPRGRLGSVAPRPRLLDGPRTGRSGAATWIVRGRVAAAPRLPRG